jgi:hypothetical protein
VIFAVLFSVLCFILSLTLYRTPTIEVRGDVTGLTAQFTNCCLKVNLDLMSPAQGLAKLKENNKAEHFEGCKRHGDVPTRGRDWRFRQAIAASGAKLEEDLISIEWRGSECDRQSQAVRRCERQSGPASKKAIPRLWRQREWTEQKEQL